MKTNGPGMHCLMYHRIDTCKTNPWGVVVSSESFEKHIRWLSIHKHVIGMEEMMYQMQKGLIDPDAVIITFDDGYADNFTTAAPILENYNCPASFFIPTYFIGKNTGFWWDDLEHIFLQSSTLPSRLKLVMGDETQVFDFDPGPLTGNEVSRLRQWRWYEPPVNARCQAFVKIWEWLRPHPIHFIMTVISELKKWNAMPETPAVVGSMDHSQLQELSENPLFTIGLHTHTHPDLSALSARDQEREMILCQEHLKMNDGITGEYFAYPYGLFDDKTQMLAKHSSIRACFTTSPSTINKESNLYQLGRFQAEEDLRVIFGSD